MLKNIKSFSFRRKKLELQNISGETLGDSISKVSIKLAEKVHSKAGNNKYLVIEFIKNMKTLLIKEQH